MKMGDFPLNFLLETSQFHLFGTVGSEDVKVHGLDEVKNFIQMENQLVIYAKLMRKNGNNNEVEKHIRFSTKVPKANSENSVDLNSCILVFFLKNFPCKLSSDNLPAAVQITSFSGPPTLALYRNINAIFTPLIQNKENLQKYVENLGEELKGEILNGSEFPLTEASTFTVVKTFEDELEFWRGNSNGKRGKSRENFIRILSGIQKEFSVIETVNLNDLEEILDNSYLILDELWRSNPPFPSRRMTHLMDVIGFDFSRCFKHHLEKRKIWLKDELYSTTAEFLIQAISLCEKWILICRQLTEIFWPNYPENPWKFGLYQPLDIVRLAERFKEILNVQTLHRQLIRLLTPDEQYDLKTDQMFGPFESLEIFELGPYTNKKWIRARKEFEYLLVPAEDRVAEKLKKQLVPHENPNARQLLHEFSRYSELIARPVVKGRLFSERQFCFKLLQTYFEQLQRPQSDTTNTNLIEEIRLSRQIEWKIKDILSVCEKLLFDLEGGDDFKEILEDYLKDLKQQHNELYQTWIKETKSLIHSNLINLKESEPVVKFSKDQLMVVNYSYRLVTLIEQVRQLKSLNYEIPAEIEDVAETAKKFLNLARILEQIANFHNTIGDRMLKCQKPMMLNSALELSKLVQEQEVVHWADKESVQKYVGSLQKSVEKLFKENQLLRDYHQQCLDKIKTLERIDLIRDYSKWKDSARELRSILQTVESKGFQNLQQWRTELDQELSKILKVQYVNSLETVHLYLPTIFTEIIYRNQHLEFQPNLEELKNKYREQLGKFLDIPKQFRGVDGTNPNCFKQIPIAGESQLKSSEELFGELEQVLKHWESWFQKEPLDLGQLTKWQNWDLYYQRSKNFSQQIAKLPSTEERVSCFVIGLTRLRSDLEALNRSYWSQLTDSLRDSIIQDVLKLQNYIDPATAFLTKVSVTLEELAVGAGSGHSRILAQAPEMTSVFDEMLQKSRILANWSGEHLDTVARISGAYQRLQNLLENHQHILSRQLQTIKVTLSVKKQNLDKDFERFQAKWHLESSKNNQLLVDLTLEDLQKQFLVIKRKLDDWDLLQQKKNELIGDYEKFGVEEQPDFNYLKTTEDTLEDVLASWKDFEEFYNGLEEFAQEEWIVVRKKLNRFEQFLKDFQTRLLQPKDGPPHHKNDELNTRILQEILHYQDLIQVLRYLKGEDFTEKHWITVFEILEMPLKQIDALVFNDFLLVSGKIIAERDRLQELCKKAAGQLVIRQALTELDQWDVQTRFQLVSHTDSGKKTVRLIRDFAEIQSKIGDHQNLLQSVKSSGDYDAFAERTNLWEERLYRLDEYLTLCGQIQRKWLYLEPIFIGGTLIKERGRFEKLTQDFYALLRSIEADPRVTNVIQQKFNGTNHLRNLLEQLERCQKSLDVFLLEKRERFPRFQFLSDEDLLQIVGQSYKEQILQTHLKKLFAGIDSIRLTDDQTRIQAICSHLGEVVPLQKAIQIVHRPVEDWLNDLVQEMQDSLRQLLVRSLSEKIFNYEKYPSQVTCLTNNIKFTRQIEDAFKTGLKLDQILDTYKEALRQYSTLHNRDQSPLMEAKLMALLFDTIHQINVLETLIKNRVRSVNDWLWQKQFRYYWNMGDTLEIRMANASLTYAYEYLGNAVKLVRTPLTERGFLTLTQALHLGMGGNPYGPAGTGKTETVKALGALLGRQVLVFNCDAAVDSQSIARILSGLVRTGAWGCFDEFNRLNEATLSAVSMHIQAIQTVLNNRNEKKLKLLDRELVLNRNCGVFITLNPAGSDYAGRNKLPDNLKQLFRPVLMRYPDQEQIATALLYCDGFQKSTEIAQKLVEIFRISNELLSRQQHYDWGLRALKTVVLSCGKFRRKNDANEFTIAVNVLRSNIVSKLTFNDAIKFQQLIRDVFESDTFQQDLEREPELRTVLETVAIKKLDLILNQRQIEKSLELLEQLKQRMGVVIVGPPGCGKTTVRQLLLEGLRAQLSGAVKEYVFNPKSMEKSRFLGHIDQDTRQWQDGVLTYYSLKATSEPIDTWTWIVLDGNIDPNWIESLNSVLDDNRLLSLPSGWRIQFNSNVNFIFETHDLTYASPATISRLGIVVLSENDFKLQDFLMKSLGNFIDDKTVKIIQKATNWMCNEGELIISNRSKVAIVQNTFAHFQMNTTMSTAVVLMNSLVPQLEQDFQEIFTTQIYDWLEDSGKNPVSKIKYQQVVEFDLKQPKIPLILTEKVARILSNLDVWLRPNAEENFLLIGPHGSGKTLILQYLADERFDMEMITVCCNYDLEVSSILEKFSQYCICGTTNRGRYLKPKSSGKNLMVHMKNLHLLQPDCWGTNQVIEFLQQIIRFGTFYDEHMEPVHLENIIIAGTMEQTGSLSNRFTSLFHCYNICLPDTSDFSTIFQQLLVTIFQALNINFPHQEKLLTCMIQVYEQIKGNFPQTQWKLQSFSPHTLTKWCCSLLDYDFPQSYREILTYEALELFGGRFPSETDWQKNLWGIFHKYLGVENPAKFSSIYYVPIEDGKYQKLTPENWSKFIGQENPNYLLSPELLRLTAGIFRNLRREDHHFVLVGKAGVGRKSAIKIVSGLKTMKIIQLSRENCIQEMKMAIQTAVVEGKPIFLQYEDDVFTWKILYVLNQLISSQEVFGLYGTVEMEALIKPISQENYVDFFRKKILENLHVVLILDVDNENLWEIFEKCPAFRDKSTIFWQDHWSNETVESIPKFLIEKLNEVENQDVPCTKSLVEIYRMIQNKTVAPFRFLSLINLYFHLYIGRRGKLLRYQSKLESGIGKINGARVLVKTLKQQAGQQEEKLAEKREKANQALDLITGTMKNANSQKDEMESLKIQTEQENQQLILRKKEIEQELLEVEPLLQEARSAVGNIRPESLSEIRSLRAPPLIIRDILEGVLRLMGIQDTSWNSMKVFLSKRGVKEEIRSFDASRILKEHRQLVENLVQSKPESFDVKNAKRASQAAAPLASWILANLKYSHVLGKIQPLEREQNKLKSNLQRAQLELGKLSAGLDSVDATVQELKTQLNLYTKEGAEIEIDLKRAQDQLGASEGLLEKLSDEYTRWQQQLEEFSQQQDQLQDNCTLSAGFITYLCDENEENRQSIMDQWIKAFEGLKFRFKTFLGTHQEFLQWQTEGLSSDQNSIENALIILNSQAVALIIDPSGSATKWIRTHFQKQQFEIIPQNSQKFTNNLELAIRFGKICLIEDLDEIPAVLLPILRQEFILQGERTLISFNGKYIDYHQNFKVFLSTKNEYFKVASNLNALLTVVNFVVTPIGLTEQLITAGIRQEHPELEFRRQELLIQREKLEQEQVQLQTRLLDDLANCSGDILENIALVNSLNETKASSQAIHQALIDSDLVQKELQKEYEMYREIAEFGSRLFFSIKTFSNTNVLYSFSVQAFIKLFLKSLESLREFEASTSGQKQHLLQNIYKYLSRGVFKMDRIPLLLFLLENFDSIPKSEWDVFLGISTKYSKEPQPKWLQHSVIKENCAIFQGTLPKLYDLLQLGQKDLWEKFMGNNSHLPEHCNRLLSDFQRILIVQLLKPDRVFPEICRYIRRKTNLKALEPGSFDLEQIFKESSNQEPILLLTTLGSDPSIEVQELAERLVGRNSYFEIAMGEGQEFDALEILEKTTTSSTPKWIILKNLHLVTEWTLKLSVYFQKLQPANENFRLWLITEPSEKFHQNFAQNCLRVVYEPPQGVKNNLFRTFSSIFSQKDGKFVTSEKSPSSSQQMKICFVLACFHTLIQERRKYIPQGWTKFYEFSRSDFSTCIKILKLDSNSERKIEWPHMIGLLSDAIYGGRIENEIDLKILNSYLEEYLNDGVVTDVNWAPFHMPHKSSLRNNNSLSDYLNWIKKMPDDSSPEQLGLPVNMDRSWDQQTTRTVLEIIKNLSLKENLRTNISMVINWQKDLVPFLKHWKKLNHGLDLVRTVIRTQENPDENQDDSIRIFFQEEYQNALELIQSIHQSFGQLNKILKGQKMANPEEQQIGIELIIQNQIPFKWRSLWLEGSHLEPFQFLRSVVGKSSYLHARFSQGNFTKNDVFQKEIHLGQLFRPNAFLAAYKQLYSRTINVPMDQLKLALKWAVPSENYIILKDLLIEGALIQESGRLSPCQPTTNSINPVPKCFMYWDQKGQNSDGLSIPIYYTAKRDQLLVDFTLNNGTMDLNQWIQNGVALYLEY